jgi:hypothetical protein
MSLNILLGEEEHRDLIKRRQKHIRFRRGTSVGVGGVIVESHVTEEVADVGEEAVVGKVVVSLRVDVQASSHARELPKNLIASLPYRITRDRVPEARCPVQRCMPADGVEES